MKVSKIRQGCREYRIIPISSLPTVRAEDGSQRTASKQELQNLGLFEFDRGASNVQVECVGYYCDVLKCGVDANGNPWPGSKLAGGKGHYRKDREPMIKENLTTYKGGVNGGRTRLMQSPLSKETGSTTTIDGETIITAAVVLSDPETERLAARLPRIMGDS